MKCANCNKEAIGKYKLVDSFGTRFKALCKDCADEFSDNSDLELIESYLTEEEHIRSSIEISASTIEEAKKAAIEAIKRKFGVPEESVESAIDKATQEDFEELKVKYGVTEKDIKIEVLQEPKKSGLFGKSKAIVSATLKEEALVRLREIEETRRKEAQERIRQLKEEAKREKLEAEEKEKRHQNEAFYPMIKEIAKFFPPIPYATINSLVCNLKLYEEAGGKVDNYGVIFDDLLYVWEAVSEDYKHRVKGRDFYDYIWYLKKGCTVNLTHLQKRMEQSGKWNPEEKLTLSCLKELLNQRFQSVDLESAKADVSPFLSQSEKAGLEFWSTDFFVDITERYLK